MPDSIQTIAGRLAAGGQGRTEADVQSDVRKFLLDAPLELNGRDLDEVLLEAQAGGGRRIDIEAGHAAIEVKKSLASPTALGAAQTQLAGYVRQRTEELQQRYVGILTDGRLWLLHHLLLDGTLVQGGEFELASGDDAEALAAWLESVLATVEQVVPTPREIVHYLGAASPAFALDLAGLQDLYRTCRTAPEVVLKRELWGRLLTAALGTNFADSDELFVTHTYLVLTAELIAHAVAGIPLGEIDDVSAVLEGEQFQLAGLHGVVEADFFDWPALRREGALVVRAISRRLARFDWGKVEHDILKALYESVIDTETRHKLGEYYTPDWLAERMVSQHIVAPLDDRILDPACGSGTFLFWAVRRVLAAADDSGMSNREALELVVDRVCGIDLHPVAVTLARVTYLLALGRERLADRGELTIPVYLGDSVRWEQDTSLLQQGGITIHTSDQMELIAQDLHFPEGVLQDPVRFDRLVGALANRVASRPSVSQAKATAARTKALIPPITGILRAHRVATEDQPAVELVFEKLCRLYDAGRDHVWGYYIRNLARPLSFTRPGAQADVLIGNPPWLAYRHMSKLLQERYEQLAKPRGLWAGGKNSPHQDLSDLFVARAVEQYLRPEGRFAFVMPFAVLSRRQYAGFRSGNFASQGAGIQAVAFDTPEEFARVKPPLFPVPACVVAGVRSRIPLALKPAALRWTGRVPSHHMGWEEAAPYLRSDASDIERAHDNEGSPYRARFLEGATFVPRVLTVVEAMPAGPLGLPGGRVAVRSARSANEKLPWKNMPTLEGVIEEQFVHPVHFGATVVAYRPRAPAMAIVPYDGTGLLDGSSDRLDEYPGLAAWWREAERLWNRNSAAKMSLRERIDYQRLLVKQFPIAEHRVAYTKSGQHLAACRISDRSAVLDQSLYWAAVDTPAEAHFLAAILNSRTLSETVEGLQARGQHNPRHFAGQVFALPFPAFRPTDTLHLHVSGLGQRAETAAAEVVLESTWQFQKARRIMREALIADGIASEIDAAVRELLAIPRHPC